MKMFQITEDDLASLERELPRLLDVAYPGLDNQQRAKWRQVREIIANVRWNYGPPSEVIVVPPTDTQENSDGPKNGHPGP